MLPPTRSVYSWPASHATWRRDCQRDPNHGGADVFVKGIFFFVSDCGIALLFYSTVYAVLDTAEGLDRAFRKLETTKDQVVWWETGAQPPQMLADGEVLMTTAYNGRIFNAQVLENPPFVIVWDGQVLDFGQLAVLAGTPRLDATRLTIGLVESQKGTLVTPILG